MPDNLKRINSLTSFKEQQRDGTLKIAHVDYEKPTFNMVLLIDMNVK